ncbi:MAG: glycosyltransferase [Casimicrobiaceae bacterium]
MSAIQLPVERLGRRPPLRLLTLTTLFPNLAQPRHGIFVANRLRRICDTGRISSTVVAAIPWFPGAYRHAARTLPVESSCGFEVFHPRYVQIPAVGMRIQPDSLAKAILGELRRRQLGADAFDVVDAHYFYPDGVAAARVAEVLRLPLVISARGSDINLIGDVSFARRRMVQAANRAQALVAVSGALAKKMTALGMPAERVRVLRNGVDTEVFAPSSKLEARRRLRLEERGPLMLGVGNLVPEKGFEVLIHALSMLPAARLLIVGQGTLAGTLRALAESVAPGRVEWRDNMSQSELRFAYVAADVLALPSLREGWPNVVLESIACGTPVVAAAVGGVPEILGNDDAPGAVVAQRAASTWAAALESMMRRALPPERVRQYALQFGWEEVVTSQCKLYEDVAKRWMAGRHKVEMAMVNAHA